MPVLIKIQPQHERDQSIHQACKVEKVVEALRENGFESVTLFVGEGTGSYKREDAFPSLEFSFTDSRIVKLELICPHEAADKAMGLINENARTQEPGDGTICLSEIEHAYRIKTGKSLEEPK